MSRIHPVSHTLRLLTIAMSGALGIAYPLASSAHTKTGTHKSGKIIHITGVRKTGHKAHAPLKAQYTEHAIGAQAIRHASPAQNAQTILARKPSINAFSTGPNGVRSTITFRAFTSGQFTETFDGIPLNDMFNGAATNSASMRNAIPLTLADTGGIQIYNGINNPAVNGYNSLGGTINFEPLQPAQHMGGAVELGYGSFDTANWGAVFNTGSLGGFRSVFSFHRQTSRGWVKNSADQNNNFYYAGVLPYDGGRSRISTYLIVNHNSGYTPHSVPEPLVNQYGISYNWPLNYDQTNNKDTEITAIIDDKSLINRWLATDSKIFYQSDNYQRTAYSNPAFRESASQPYYLPNQGTGYNFWSSYPNPPTYNPAATFGSVHNGTDYQLYQDTSSDLGYSPKVTILAPHNTVTVGGNVTYGLLRSAEYWYGSAPVPQIPGYNNAWYEHDERLLASAYAQDEVRLFDHTVHITPGVKFLDAYTISSDAIGIYYPIGGTVANNQHFVSPTLGLNYAPLPGFSVYASWGRNIKFPNIGAYYSNIAETNAAGQYVVVPISIKPEYVTDYELGTRYRHAGFLGSIDAYREYFTNTFVSVTNPTTALSTTTNGGRSRYQGIELTLEQHFGHILVGRWLGYANYSYNQAVFTSSFDSSAVGQVSAGQPLANVPKNMVNVGLGWRLGGIDARIGAKYVGPQYVNQQFAGVPGGLKIPGYTVTNIGLFDTIPLHEVDVKSVRLALNIDNAFNHHYVVAATSNSDYYGNPYLSVFEGMPFSVYGSATLTF